MWEKREYQEFSCLVGDAEYGPIYIVSSFDCLPRDVRKRIADSPFNICPACVQQAMHSGWDPIQIIEEMERLLRKQYEWEDKEWTE